MRTFGRDFVLGVRQLVRRPGFAAAAIASLALGIGLNTTLFSVVNGVLLREGALADPDRLVEIYTGLNKDYPQLTTSYPDYEDLARGVDALSGMAANAYVRGILSGAGGGRSSLVTGETVTGNYFDVLGVAPAVGRGFRSDEARVVNETPVVVLSDGLWRRQFGARPDVVGQTVRLSGVTYTVIGVAPREFTGTIPGIPTDFWVPVTMVERLVFSGVQAVTDQNPGTSRIDRRGTRWLFVKGRLAPGRSVDEARAQAEAVFARLRAEHPGTNEDAAVSVVPAAGVRFHPLLDGYVRAASAVLLAAVSLVLMIACANVANMVLARSAGRRREFALRAALGASRARLLRQLLTEGLVLASAGGAVGVLIAWWAGRALSGIGTSVFPMPIEFDFSIDRTVLLFAAGVSLATAVLCSLVPAWSGSRPSLVPALKDSGDGAGGRRFFTLSHALVVGQLALSLVLLVVGALLGRGLLAARGTDIGFDPAPVASLSFNLQMNGYDVDRAVALRDRAMEALRALPGVTHVSTASRLPMAPDINVDQVLVRGHHAPGVDGTPTDTAAVGADYFATVGVPIVAGRAFTRDDVTTRRRVAIVNETMARRYWPSGQALGQQLFTGGWESEPYEVVGVARDHKVRSVGEPPRDYLLRPAGRSRAGGLVGRTTTPAALALPQLRQTLWSIEPDILFTEDVPVSDVVATTMAPTQMGATVLGAFGVLALLLAGVGLYGVIAYSVSRRTREVGIRMALGAPRARVIRLVILQGAKLAAAGVTLGLMGAALVTGLLESMLYGVSGLDPVAYAAAAGVLALVTLIANAVPAYSAARVDPIRALRSES
jgi:predicted permease